MSSILLITVPVVGAITGWIIISIVVKLLFWPQRPRKIPYTNITLHGLVHKKREEVAVGVEAIIEGYLQSAVAGDSGPASDLLGSVTVTAIRAVEEHLENKIPLLIPRKIKQKIIVLVGDIIRKEIPSLIETMADNPNTNSTSTVLTKYAEDRIRDYDLSVLEQTMLNSKEVILVKVGAAIIGFISGLIQLFTLWLVAA